MSLLIGGNNMSESEDRYYAYDKKQGKFVTVDGRLAEVSESFKKDMIDMNVSYMIFVKKEDYEKYNDGLFVFKAMEEEG